MVRPSTTTRALTLAFASVKSPSTASAAPRTSATTSRPASLRAAARGIVTSKNDCSDRWLAVSADPTTLRVQCTKAMESLAASEFCDAAGRGPNLRATHVHASRPQRVTERQLLLYFNFFAVFW